MGRASERGASLLARSWIDIIDRFIDETASMVTRQRNRFQKANLINSRITTLQIKTHCSPSFTTTTKPTSMQPTRHIMLAIVALFFRRLRGARTCRRRRLIPDRRLRIRREGPAHFRIAYGRQVPGRWVLYAWLRRAESAPHGVGGAGGEAGDALEDAVVLLLRCAGFF
jgi:hypothetical protein